MRTEYGNTGDWRVQGNTECKAYATALNGLRRGLWVVGGVSAVISLLMLTGSIYMLQIYDRVLNSGSVPTLMVLFGLVVVLYGFLALYDGLRMRLLSRLALNLDAALAQAAFRSDLTPARDGAPVTQASTDLETVRLMLSGPGMLALFDLPFTVIFVAVLFVIHPALGVLTLVGMTLAAILAWINRMVLKTPTAEAQGIEVAQRQFAESARLGAASLGALGMRGAISARWQDVQRARLAVLQRGQEPSEMLAATSRAFRLLLQAALLTAAAWLVLQGTLTAGAIIAASILSGRALAPVDQLIGQWRALMLARASHARLKTAPLDSAPPRLELPPITGALTLENVSRNAPGAQGEDPVPVLKEVSFTLAPGAGLGIIGASASGKSTLARLIVGAIAPDSGRIRFDGATIGQWDADTLGRQIGYLPQRVDLLPGTIRDNICRFDAEATDAAVLRAARAAGVHEMILRLPEGYGTRIGGQDAPLSGGQIQRIGLARALYGDPKLLVLDEPNAHLDKAGEAALATALAARRKAGASVIVLAHRAGALIAVDRLIVLEEGRIAHDGPRDEVLASLGAAARRDHKGPDAPPAIAFGARSTVRPRVTIRPLRGTAQTPDPAIATSRDAAPSAAPALSPDTASAPTAERSRTEDPARPTAVAPPPTALQPAPTASAAAAPSPTPTHSAPTHPGPVARKLYRCGSDLTVRRPDGAAITPGAATDTTATDTADASARAPYLLLPSQKVS